MVAADALPTSDNAPTTGTATPALKAGTPSVAAAAAPGTPAPGTLNSEDVTQEAPPTPLGIMLPDESKELFVFLGEDDKGIPSIKTGDLNALLERYPSRIRLRATDDEIYYRITGLRKRVGVDCPWAGARPY